mgnify:CR=1 FL=1
MQQKEKSGFAKTFAIWFGLGALMFGTFCGANMASGVYASTYIVTLGGGMVEITMTGAHEVTALKLKPEIVDPEDIEMLEDLLAAAVNEAVRVVDEATQQGMSSVTGALAGLNLPGGFGLCHCLVLRGKAGQLDNARGIDENFTRVQPLEKQYAVTRNRKISALFGHFYNIKKPGNSQILFQIVIILMKDELLRIFAHIGHDLIQRYAAHLEHDGHCLLYTSDAADD